MADPIARKRPRPPATLEKDDDGQSNHNRNNNNNTTNNSNNDDEADDQRSITTSSCSFSHTNFVESASRVDSNAEVPRAPLMDAPPPRRCMGKSPVKVDITDVDDGQSRNQQGGEDSPLRTSTNSAAAFSSSRGGYASAISDSRSVAATSGGGCVDTSRRMKQPTLAVYGMVSDTAVLKKELATRCEQVEELLAKGKAMDEELSRRDTHIHFVEEQVQFLTNKLSRFTDVMREEMLCAAQKSRVDARRVRCGNHFDLGQIVTWPTSRQEAWVEGNKKRELIEELAQVTRRRDEVEGLKKAAQNQLKQLSRQERDREDSAAGPDFAEALMDAQEELQLRSSEQAAHINRIAHIKIKLEKLEGDKKAFMKEIRRITDEDASDFVMVPTIGEHSRYVLIHLLGKGGFSEVWKAFDLVDGMYVACKIHRINREWPAQTKAHYLRHAERELHIMRSLNHSHLTKLYDVFQHNEGMSVSVMEYSKGMDLDTYLKSYRTLRESDARLILLQMASALRYLSTLDNPIIHYDLKPANILFHSDDPAVLEIKITDFGLSKIIGAAREGPSDNPSIELTSQGTGTYWYLPPECFETSTTPRVSNKVDIWSVGVIFYQMLFGVRPFAEGESQRKIWSEKLILSSARSINFPDAPKVSDEAKEVIRHCLAFNVSERYDILQLSNHPYLFRPTRRTRNAESERRMTGYPSSSPRPN